MKEIKIESEQVIEFIQYVKHLNLNELNDLENELILVEYELADEKDTELIKAHQITKIDALKKLLNKAVELQSKINYIKLKLVIIDNEVKIRLRKKER